MAMNDPMPAAGPGAAAPPEAAPSPARSAEPGRVDALDGVRTIAVFSVMLVHSAFPGSELGWLGVDVFFVLSGFLITTLLCSERRRTGRISLPKFWARRFLRLMPAYWIYAGTLTVWILLDWGKLTPHGGWTPAGYLASLWAYFVNYVPQGGLWSMQSLSLHLWSLAVEEQFYFLWPVLAALAFRLRRPWLVAWGMVLLVMVRRLLMPTDVLGMTGTLSTRGIGIVLGCATAMTLALAGRPRWLSSARLRAGVLLGLGVAIAVLTVLVRRGQVTELEVKAWAVPWLCVGVAAAIAMLWYGPPSRVTAVLSSRPMAYLGQISYGLYLYHMLAHWLVWDVLLPGHEDWNRYAKYGLRTVVFIGLTVLISAASYHLVEKRFLALKNRLR